MDATDEMDDYLSNIPAIDMKGKLDRMGFFEAPASRSHHLAMRGGLARHSVNVTRWLLRLSEAMCVHWPRCESPYIVGMLHDLVKTRCYEIRLGGAVENIVMVPQPYAGHGSASAIMIQSELGIFLHPAEASAIVHHMGAFNLQGRGLEDYNGALDIFPKEIIATHTADMLASRWDDGHE